MNYTSVRTTLALGMAALALAAAPVSAERYIVEPITDGSYAVEAAAFSQAELDQMLAPIALYPDSLLSQVLIAATYPLEVVEAARWSRQNPHLKGEEAVAAVANRGWDPSVQALVAFPEILAQMDEDLEWTRRVGDAMLYQDAQVMDSVQFLRARADAAGNLQNTEHVRVIREEKIIVIEPAQPRVVYVPYYDPVVVYGTWWRPAYPPVVWARPSYYHYGYPGFYWGPAVHISSGFFYTGFYWPQRTVVVVNAPRYYNPPRHRGSYVHYTPGNRWTHNPAHRRGVNYRHPEVRERYQQPALRAGPSTRWPMEQRSDRNRSGEQRGDRPRSADRSRSDHTRSGERYTGGTPERTQDRDTGTVRDRNARDSAEAPRLSAGPRTIRPTISGTQEQLQRQSWTGRGEQRDRTSRSQPQSHRQPQADNRDQAAPSRPSRSASATTRSVPQSPQAGATSRRNVQASVPNVSRQAAPPSRASRAAPQAAPPSRAPQASAPSRAPQAARQAPAPASRAASPPAQNRGNASPPRGRSNAGDARAERGGQERRERD